MHAKEIHTIECWDSLVKYCYKLSGEFLVDFSDSKRINIFKLTGTPPIVEHSVFISDNFHVATNFRGISNSRFNIYF